MTPIQTGLQATRQGLALLPASMTSPAAIRLMLAIGLQESGFIHRWQIVNPSKPDVMGPARGFWQFEQGGGVKGVLNHARSAYHAQQVCRQVGVPPVAPDVYNALSQAQFDPLAAAFARLLLWTDPRALPTTEQAAWDCYVRNWRPGKPHPQAWPRIWQEVSNVKLD